MDKVQDFYRRRPGFGFQVNLLLGLKTKQNMVGLKASADFLFHMKQKSKKIK